MYSVGTDLALSPEFEIEMNFGYRMLITGCFHNHGRGEEEVGLGRGEVEVY